MIAVTAQIVGEYLEHRSARALLAIPDGIGRLREAQRRGETSAAWWHQVLLADPCSYCGQPSQHVDHVHPRVSGGSDQPSNLIGACGTCNSSKGAVPLLAFLLRRTA